MLGEKKRVEERLEEEVRERSMEVARLTAIINHRDTEVSTMQHAANLVGGGG